MEPMMPEPTTQPEQNTMNAIADPTDLRRYRILGLTVETDFVFQTHLRNTTNSPELRFRLTKGPNPPQWPVPAEPSFESPIKIDSGQPFVSLHQGTKGDLLRFSEVSDFYLTDDEIRCHLLDPEYAFMVEVHLMGTVLSYWLERRGIPVLHASAVSLGDHAVAFLGTNKAGKSSLSVSLMQQGYPLLSDDLVGLQVTESGIEARPGFPSMRMWPDLAQHVVGEHWAQLPLAHPRFEKRRTAVGPEGFGQFIDEAQPIACLYLPERVRDAGAPSQIRIEPVPPGEAIFEFLRESFLPQLTQAAGFAPGRLKVFSMLTAKVPVRRLIYPAGFPHLSGVSARIVEDLGVTPAAKAR
jgi:hypothetical protein